MMLNPKGAGTRPGRPEEKSKDRGERAAKGKRSCNKTRGVVGMGPLTRKAQSGVEIQRGAGMKNRRREAAGEEGSEVRGESAPRQKARQHKPNPASVGTPEAQAPK